MNQAVRVRVSRVRLSDIVFPLGRVGVPSREARRITWQRRGHLSSSADLIFGGLSNHSVSYPSRTPDRRPGGCATAVRSLAGTREHGDHTSSTSLPGLD